MSVFLFFICNFEPSYWPHTAHRLPKQKEIKNNINEFQMELRTTYIRKTASG